MPQTPVGTKTDTKVPTLVTNLKSALTTEPPDIVTNTFLFHNDPTTGLETTPTPIGSQTQTFTSLTSADIDGDGVRDLVVAFKENPTTPLKRSGVRVYLNPGTGDFATVTPIEVGAMDTETEAVTTLDINNDGNIDIIAGNKNQPNMVYLNLGGGVFSNAIDIGTDADETTSVTTGDVFNDGVDAVIVGNAGSANKVYRVSSAGANSVDFLAGIEVGTSSQTDDTRAVTVRRLPSFCEAALPSLHPLC